MFADIRHRFGFLVGIALGHVAIVGVLAAATPTYRHHVLPLVERRCVACHGEQASGGLDLRSLVGVMAGGASGPVVEPGRPDKSLLWMKIASDAMPMGGAPLSIEEKNLFREWIEHGHFPDSDSPTANLSPEERVRKQVQGVWAFQKPVKQTPPEVAHLAHVRTPIDAFVLAKLEEKGFGLNPEASREKLIRRAYLDLIGLPPTPEETAEFVSDDSPRAFENLIDRLLDSPHYGERWARHWMDVAGYTDGNGYLGDEPRTHSWQYRDWVIRALNDDMPYDQFLTEQLAGDQVAEWHEGERFSPDAADKLRATGFLRLTPDGTDNQTIYQIDKQWDALHAVTEVAVKAVMGINLNCLRCHDHKFDPFLHEDYYRMMALFRPVFDPDDEFPDKDTKWLAANVGSGAWPARFIPDATTEEMERYLALQEAGPGFRELFGARGAAQERWTEAQLKKLDEPERSTALAAHNTPKEERTEGQSELVATYAEQFKATNEELAGFDPEYGRLQAEREEATARALAAKPEMIWAAWDVSKDAETRVLERGSYESPGDLVEPGVPVIFDDPENPFQIPEQPTHSPHTGRRLAFARWLTSGEHPLAARVIVNRVWQYHLGQGIVATPDDFGSQGAPPTHPELLDWLAVSLVEHDWSLKWLHRQIMLSNVYRQSSDVNGQKYLADEPNKLLGRWQPRRLEAEAIRDAILQVSGRLTPVLYGEAIALCSADDGNYLPATSGRVDGRNIRGFDFEPPPCEAPDEPLDDSRKPTRRSIYIQSRRVAAAGFLKAFDQPLMDTNAPVRFRSAVPQQALSALHNPLMLESAASLAARTLEDVGDDVVARIRRAIELVYSRPATESEIAFGFGQIQQQGDGESGLRLFCQALLGSNEFLYID